MITTGKLLAEYIALFGKMAVYKTNVINDTNVGGYIGYFSGDDGSGTTGITMSPATGNNKIAVSTGGASINGGTPFFSVANRCQCSGNLTVTGNASLATASINGYGDLRTALDNIWNALNNKAAANHTH